MKNVFYLALGLLSGVSALAQTSTYGQRIAADTFVSSGQSNLNFGNLGAMEIAATNPTQPRTLLSLLRFDTSGLQANFDADFGTGNWLVNEVTLTLFSSFATAGQQPGNSSFNKIAAGTFEFDLLNNDNWDESGITWNTLPTILPSNNNGNTLTSLGTFFWAANGQTSFTWSLNTDLNLIQKIQTGNPITLLGQPTAGSAVSYLFNSQNSNPPYLNVRASLVPEPSTFTLLASVLSFVIGVKYRRK